VFFSCVSLSRSSVPFRCSSLRETNSSTFSEFLNSEKLKKDSKSSLTTTRKQPPPPTLLFLALHVLQR